MYLKNSLINALILFPGAVLLLSSCAVTKYKIDSTRLDRYLEKQSVFTNSHSGLLVYDPENETVVFDYHADKKFIPASNTKLLTYFAMVSMLGDSIPGFEYCISGDSLYFTGTGDPTLLYENFDYNKTFVELQDHKGPLVYVERPMIDERLGPGWAWDDYPYYYSAERSTFPIYGNMVRFEKEETEDRIRVDPSHFEMNVLQVHSDEVTHANIERHETSNEYRISLPTHTPIKIDDELPFIYSNALFLQLLSDTLRRPILAGKAFPDCDRHVFYSMATDSIAKYILTNSDNFLAEQMLPVISNQLGDTLSSAKSIEHLLDNQLSDIKGEISWVDGSGLSRYNLVSPRAIVTVLNKIRQTVPTSKLYQLLPESGRSGTLKNSFASLEGKIHAKTGSMSHVYNLSGFVETKSGKTLLFSFMNNNFTVSFKELKAEMERVFALFIND